MKKVQFTSKFNGKDVTLESCEINPRVRRESEKYANLALQQAIADGFQLQIQAEQTLKNQGFDFNKYSDEINQITKELKEMEVRLFSGRVGERRLTKSEGRELAIKMRNKRGDLLDATSRLNSIYSRTAERQAENERWQYFVFATTLDPVTGRPFFKNFDEFKENGDSQLAVDATSNFAKLLSGENNIDASYPENRWLIKYGFMDNNLNFLNENGQLCDEDFRLVNKDGRFIDKDGNLIDRHGNKVDESGNLLIETVDSYQE